MKKIYLAAALLITFNTISCTQSNKDGAIDDGLFAKEEVLPKPYVADNFPVSDKMFGKARANRPVITPHLRSENTAWFTNDSLKQTLMFILSSDNDRLYTAGFDNNNLPDEFILRNDLSDENNYHSSGEHSLQYFSEFFNKAKKIDSKYFTSNMGFKIGDVKEKAIDRYGKPDSIKTADGFEKYYWNPVAAQVTKQHVPEKDLIIIDEKKQFIEMYFKNNKLVVLIFDNVTRYPNE